MRIGPSSEISILSTLLSLSHQVVLYLLDAKLSLHLGPKLLGKFHLAKAISAFLRVLVLCPLWLGKKKRMSCWKHQFNRRQEKKLQVRKLHQQKLGCAARRTRNEGSEGR